MPQRAGGVKAWILDIWRFTSGAAESAQQPKQTKEGAVMKRVSVLANRRQLLIAGAICDWAAKNVIARVRLIELAYGLLPEKQRVQGLGRVAERLIEDNHTFTALAYTVDTQQKTVILNAAQIGSVARHCGPWLNHLSAPFAAETEGLSRDLSARVWQVNEDAVAFVWEWCEALKPASERRPSAETASPAAMTATAMAGAVA